MSCPKQKEPSYKITFDYNGIRCVMGHFSKDEVEQYAKFFSLLEGINGELTITIEQVNIK